MVKIKTFLLVSVAFCSLFYEHIAAMKSTPTSWGSSSSFSTPMPRFYGGGNSSTSVTRFYVGGSSSTPFSGSYRKVEFDKYQSWRTEHSSKYSLELNSRLGRDTMLEGIEMGSSSKPQGSIHRCRLIEDFERDLLSSYLHTIPPDKRSEVRTAIENHRQSLDPKITKALADLASSWFD